MVRMWVSPAAVVLTQPLTDLPTMTHPVTTPQTREVTGGTTTAG